MVAVLSAVARKRLAALAISPMLALIGLVAVPAVQAEAYGCSYSFNSGQVTVHDPGGNFTLSGLLAFALSPLVVFLYGLGNHAVAAVSFLAILVLWSHRRNIREEFTRSVLGRPVKDGRSQKGMES